MFGKNAVLLKNPQFKQFCIRYHLAECCITSHQPDNNSINSSSGEPQLGVGAGMTHKVIAANPGRGHNTSDTPGTVASLSLEFGYECLKNAENLLPASDRAKDTVFCEGVGFIGNPISWEEVEQLRVAIIACKCFTSLALHDYIPSLHYAEQLLTMPNLPSCYSLLAHLYAAESLILQDRLAEALTHLDPESLEEGWEEREGWSPGSVESAKQVVQYNLAVGFALRDEWEKASSLISQLYKENQDVSVEVRHDRDVIWKRPPYVQIQ